MNLRSKLYEPLHLPVILLVVAALGGKMLQPRFQARSAPAFAQRDTLRQAKARLASTDQAAAAQLRAKLQSEREAIAAIELLIPTVENLPNLMTRMQERAAMLQLKLGDIEPLSSSPLAAQGTAPYAATAYAISIRGRWAPLTQLLAEMARQGEMVVPSVESVKADSAGSVLDVRLVVTLIGMNPPALGQVIAAPAGSTSSATGGVLK